MKLQVTNYLAIELTEPNELLELMSEDDKLHFMQSLSSHEIIIKHVADQIISGFTEDGYSGNYSGVESKPHTALQTAVRDISIKSGEIARKEIESLQRALAVTEKVRDEYSAKYWDLYHGRMPK